MQALLGLARRIDRLNRWIGEAVALLTGVMVLVGAFNALARYVERNPTVQGLLADLLGTDERVQIASNAYLELQWYLFSLVFLLGAGHALAKNWHVRVDVVYGRVGAKARVWIDLLGTLALGIPFCVLALWASWESVLNSWAVREVSPDPGGLWRYPIKSAVLVGFALLLAQALSAVIKRVAWLTGAELWDGAIPEIEEPEGSGEEVLT